MLLPLLLQVAVPATLETLPPLPLLHRRPDPPSETALFVRDEVRSGRCAAPAPVAGNGLRSLTVHLAVLVGPRGTVKAVMPRAIGCVAVEQYAVGLASRLIRGNVNASGGDSWYRMPLTFSWTD